MAIYANLTADQGSDFSYAFIIEDTTGNAKNITNYTLRGQVRKTYSSSTATDFTITATDASAGEIDIELTAANTAALKAGRYVYDVEIESTGGEITRVIEGQLEITPRVTRTS